VWLQVGAPPDVLERLTAMAAKLDARPPGRHEPRDPELDQFMVGHQSRPSFVRFISLCIDSPL
jgi:hypothetical protein